MHAGAQRGGVTKCVGQAFYELCNNNARGSFDKVSFLRVFINFVVSLDRETPTRLRALGYGRR